VTRPTRDRRNRGAERGTSVHHLGSKSPKIKGTSVTTSEFAHPHVEHGDFPVRRRRHDLQLSRQPMSTRSIHRERGSPLSLQAVMRPASPATRNFDHPELTCGLQTNDLPAPWAESPAGPIHARPSRAPRNRPRVWRQAPQHGAARHQEDRSDVPF